MYVLLLTWLLAGGALWWAPDLPYAPLDEPAITTDPGPAERMCDPGERKVRR